MTTPLIFNYLYYDTKINVICQYIILLFLTHKNGFLMGKRKDIDKKKKSYLLAL